MQHKTHRKRVRDLGLRIGRFPTGKLNSITDVKGLKVGHSTLIKGKGKLKTSEGPVRSGVTAIIPNHDIYMNPIMGGAFILNGAGEVSGLTQVVEWGTIETPILLTNTLSVGTCSESLVKYMTKMYPSIGSEDDVVIPLVGECDDSWLNDITGRHVQDKHVFEALTNAHSGVVEEGSVGGGTGMITCDFKGGIGTSSRKVFKDDGGYHIGVLVMSNFGNMRELRFDGIPVGQILEENFAHVPRRANNYGSIICVIATDAPLLQKQLERLAKRAAIGIGRVGSHAAHGSGEIILALSTANTFPRHHKNFTYKINALVDDKMNTLYEAVIDATEEAILNSLCMSDEMYGANDHYVPGLPLDRVHEIIRKYNGLRYIV